MARPHRVPCFSDEIKVAIRQRRRAERKWRISGLEFHLKEFKTKKNYVIFLMNESRCKFYSSFVEKHRITTKEISFAILNSYWNKTLVVACLILKVTMPLPMILVDFSSRKSPIFDLNYAFNIPPLPLINTTKITSKQVMSRSIKNSRLLMKFLKITSELS
jgi:hypothetical protein